MIEGEILFSLDYFQPHLMFFLSQIVSLVYSYTLSLLALLV